jgi:hypothetical protein
MVSIHEAESKPHASCSVGAESMTLANALRSSLIFIYL